MFYGLATGARFCGFVNGLYPKWLATNNYHIIADQIVTNVFTLCFISPICLVFHLHNVMFLQLSVTHSVHRGGVCPSACWDTHFLLWADTPLGRHPHGQTPPLADTPWARHPGQTPPGADTPLGKHSPCPVHVGIHIATAADGTHPTRMHYCQLIISGFFWDFLMRKLRRFSGRRTDWPLPGLGGRMTNRQVELRMALGWWTASRWGSRMGSGRITGVRRIWNTIVKVVIGHIIWNTVQPNIYCWFHCKYALMLKHADFVLQ